MAVYAQGFGALAASWHVRCPVCPPGRVTGPRGAVTILPAGAGWQLGAGLTDVVVVLRNLAAVRAFCGSQLGVCGSLSIAAGPLGREAAAKLALGSTGAGALCYSYSCSRGAYVGLGLEGTLLRTRDAVNHLFYGRPLPAKALLLAESSPPPAAAAALYAALDQLLFSVEQPGGTGQFSVRADWADSRPGAEEEQGAGLVAEAAAWGSGVVDGREALACHSGSGHSRGRIGERTSAASPAAEPASPPPRRGRERERERVLAQHGGDGRGVAYEEVAGARQLWHVPSAPAYSNWEDGEPLPSLFD
jgi:hypothetical protein